MIPYVREIKFDYGACDQVSPLIRRVVANNPGKKKKKMGSVL